jgi:hypothetical protein
MPDIAKSCFSGTFSICALLLMLAGTNVFGEEHEPATELVEGRFFALPLELDLDSGATNGDATIFRIVPLYGKPSSDNWKLINLDMLTLADAPGGIPGRPGNPNPEPGSRTFGIGDVVHGSFFTAPTTGNLIWGIGPMLSIPTASDDTLGSGKWSAGPAFRLAYRKGLWNVGVFGGQTWSFAGDDDRKDVSQLIMRGAIRRQLPNDWYFVSAPIITANWKASDEKWLVPVGGGIGKVIRIRTYPWALSFQGYYNVIKPGAAPNWSVRFSVIMAIPAP